MAVTLAAIAAALGSVGTAVGTAGAALGTAGAAAGAAVGGGALGAAAGAIPTALGAGLSAVGTGIGAAGGAAGAGAAGLGSAMGIPAALTGGSGAAAAAGVPAASLGVTGVGAGGVPLSLGTAIPAGAAPSTTAGAMLTGTPMAAQPSALSALGGHVGNIARGYQAMNSISGKSPPNTARIGGGGAPGGQQGISSRLQAGRERRNFGIDPSGRVFRR